MIRSRSSCRRVKSESKWKLELLVCVGLLAAMQCPAQDLQKGVTYVCNGEKIFIDSCNIRDTSDSSTCMVGHPDTILPNGLMKYTTETRGSLKKLLPTCKQPTAEQMAKAKAFEKKQNDLYAANAKKAEQEVDANEARAQAAITGRPALSPEERATNRCITAGRLPASCTGNMLLGAFSKMLTSVTGENAEPAAGPVMAGAYEGPGNWRLDFIDMGVLVNCSMLSPNQQFYKLNFNGANPTITINTTPKPLVLTLTPDGRIVGPGPVTIDGVIASGYTPGTTTTQKAIYVSQDYAGNKYDAAGNKVEDKTVTTPGYTNFSPKRTTCPAVNLSTKGAAVGIQTMQTDLLKTMFSGEKGPPTPPGIRMNGIYAAATGFSVQFFPESAVLGCGPDAARAYAYKVVAGAGKAVVEIAAPDHPLSLAMKADGSLDPGGTGVYQVHGRVITGQTGEGDFTFAPLEKACNLAVLTASKSIPASGGVAATAAASGPATLSTPAAPLGNATLLIVSGFPAQAGAPNTLAGHPYLLLRDSYGAVLAKAGLRVPAGMSPYKFVGMACANRTPDCQKALEAVKASAASAVRADANGSGTFPGVPPGTYYLMISARYNNQALVWEQPIQLKAGANTVKLDQSNATPLN
jgi:hypothetical protein